MIPGLIPETIPCLLIHILITTIHANIFSNSKWNVFSLCITESTNRSERDDQRAQHHAGEIGLGYQLDLPSRESLHRLGHRAAYLDR